MNNHFFCDRCGNHYSDPGISQICPPCHYAVTTIDATQHRFVGPTKLIRTAWIHRRLARV